MKTHRPLRIAALDIFRALTMFLMLFVNDIPGLKNIPHWLLHASYNEDMLGFSDTIFPAFLFAMGMAVPYAVDARIKKGDSFLHILTHIFWRTLALVVMGVYTVNRDTIDPIATGMSQPIFSLLMVVAFFLIWNLYPKVKGKGRYIVNGLKTMGILLLVYLYFIYVGVNGTVFAPQWWGILGLIGWTYLVCSVVYLVLKKNMLLNTLAFLLFIILTILSAKGIFQDWKWVHYLPSQVTLHAFGIAGMWTGLIMQKYADKKHPRLFFTILGVMGVLMLGAGVYAHQYWIISKLQGTPTWLFYCCALFFPLFGALYWLTDIKNKSNWFDMIKPAGVATLTCYIIPYAWYSMESLLHVHYPAWLQSGILGLVKSIVFSLLVIWVAWILMKFRVRLKI